MWDEITYPILNFNGYIDEVWEWINNFIPHFALWNSTQNLNPYTAKCAFYEVLKIYRIMMSQTYDILSLSETDPFPIRSVDIPQQVAGIVCGLLIND